MSASHCGGHRRVQWALKAVPAIVALVCAGLQTPAQALDLTWYGGTGDWGDGTHWSPVGGPPTAADLAVITAGNAQLSFATAIARLNLTGGQVSGAGQLTVAGASIWTGGTQAGTGISQFNGTLSISGAINQGLAGGRMLNATDTTTWSGNTAANNNAIVFSGGTINNTGTWNDANGFASYIQSFSGTNAFNNAGIFNKQGSAITTMDVVYNNSGNTNVDTGRFRMTGGGTSNGAFNVAAGAVLDFNAGTHNLNAVTIAGTGTTEISGSTSFNSVNLNGGTLSSALLISGGNLQGADHSLSGPVTWTGGNIRGAASTTVASTLAISGAGNKGLSGGRVLNATDTTTWSGNTAANNNAIIFSGSGTINNTGTWNDANTFASYMQDFTGTNAFNNAGTFNKQANTTTTVGVTLNNTGTVNVNAGTMTVTSALTNRGVIQVAAGATFLGSNATFVNAGALTGNGTVATHANGDILNQGGAINPGMAGIGHLSIGGTLVNAANGTLNFDLASLASFDTLAVSDNVKLSGGIGIWNAGYTPMLGDSFSVMTFADRINASQFDALSLHGFAIGTAFMVTYNQHDVTLTVSAVAAVPEPQTSLMLFAGLAVLGTVLQRRRA